MQMIQRQVHNVRVHVQGDVSGGIQLLVPELVRCIALDTVMAVIRSDDLGQDLLVGVMLFEVRIGVLAFLCQRLEELGCLQWLRPLPACCRPVTDHHLVECIALLRLHLSRAT